MFEPSGHFLERFEKLSAKCYLWMFGDKKVSLWKRVEHEY